VTRGGVVRVSRLMRYRAAAAILLACTVVCSEKDATGPVPFSGLSLVTDSGSYLLNNTFGRVVDVLVTNTSDTTIHLASCGPSLQPFPERLSPRSYEAEFYCDRSRRCPDGQSCAGYVQDVPLAPGEAVRANARFQYLGTFRFRIPLYRGFRSVLSTETSNSFEIRLTSRCVTESCTCRRTSR
jgi:hypothetical protein